MTDFAVQMGTAKLIPVITIHDPAHAVPLARALVAGGVPMLEVTLRTQAGAEAARLMANEVEGAIVGFGTVLNGADLDLAERLGLRFAFSPGASPALLDAARGRALPFVPGIQTATELMQAAERGFSVCKFFPAEPAGGIAALKALAGPFPQARFCPTGGIAEERVPAWLEQPNVLAVGGSWLASAADITHGNWPAIEARARRAMARLNQEEMTA